MNIMTPGMVVRHKNPEFFESGAGLFSGPGVVTECHGSEFVRVLWQSSLTTAFHSTIDIEPINQGEEDGPVSSDNP